jgi:hypothetical protein
MMKVNSVLSLASSLSGLKAERGVSVRDLYLFFCLVLSFAAREKDQFSAQVLGNLLEFPFSQVLSIDL